MSEVLNFVPAKEGLTALDRFVAGRSEFTDLPPFTLPARWRIEDDRHYREFSYFLSPKKYFYFYLPMERLTVLGDNIYVIPHRESSRGYNPYYWLTLHASPATDSSLLTSCRLRPEEETHQINFKTWRGLEEQLLADYTLGVNNLRFADLLPFDIANTGGSPIGYRIAGEVNLAIRIREDNVVQENDVLRFIPKTDDQELYEWMDILKVSDVLPEERWPLVCSYRILAAEHRIYSKGWFGYEKQLLADRIQDRPNIQFSNLRPIRAIAISGGKTVHFFHLRSAALRAQKPSGIRVNFILKPGVLAPDEETISIPRQDDQGLYEWLDIYRFDPTTHGPRGEVITSGRITPDGINQQYWRGFEKQLLNDYTKGLVSFHHLRTITIMKGKNEGALQVLTENEHVKNSLFLLRISKGFNLKPGDKLALVPEKESKEGTDFLLTKDGITIARYRLNLTTKKFTCIKEREISPEEADERLLDFFEEVGE